MLAWLTLAVKASLLGRDVRVAVIAAALKIYFAHPWPF